ncbi:GFA family protein [Acinetobacter sp. S40]|uniref:GFA family protein n=1 Tax=Acinetobacter sp. S40 TaxID=2767434 RepID=UPI00190C8F68|nr:GFA family protein [Acinetobacter sp. S40]MBJ9985836.1 GFA family protein [Acinetobacter sp. S40]
MFTASCLCEGIQLRLLAPLNPIYICHCKQCQKAQGAAFAAITQVEIKDMQVVKGENLLQSYFATPNKKRVFCKQCGSPVYSARLDKPDVVRLRAGLINESVDVNVVSHAYVNSKAFWHVIGDQAPQYPEALPSIN